MFEMLLAWFVLFVIAVCVIKVAWMAVFVVWKIVLAIFGAIMAIGMFCLVIWLVTWGLSVVGV